MENLNQPNNNLSLTETAKSFLIETAKWTNFLAIMGFIMIGIMVIFAFVISVSASTIPGFAEAGISGGIFGFIYLIFAGVYYIPISYLYKFSKNLKSSFANNDEMALEKGFEYLKSHYKFMGVLTIIMLAFYALAFVFGLLAAMMV